MRNFEIVWNLSYNWFISVINQFDAQSFVLQ